MQEGRRLGPRWLAIALIGAVTALLAGAFAAVSTARGGSDRVGVRQPLTVQSATLTQEGQDLVWTVELDQSFSPRALRHDGRSLCLLVEPRAKRAETSQVCLMGPRTGARAPRLVYVPAGREPGAGTAIAATITRSSDRELTASFVPGAVGLSYRPLRWQIASTVTAPDCLPAMPSQRHCTILFPARPALVPLHTPQLVGCAAAGPDWVFHGPADKREIALTFDDGPWWEPPTSQFVRLLAREHAPATFFEVGEHIATYDPHGTIERQMLADGDMIGDHTWSHPDMIGLPAAQQREEIARAANAIHKATGFEPCLFRAPDGATEASLLAVARSMGFRTIQWDVDPRDWALPGTLAIIDNVVANAHNGAIVEEHFGGGPRYQTLDALPREIAELRAKGYRLVTLTQMLGYRLLYR